MKILIVVTHLLGTGHLARALVLGRAFRTAGHRVTIASGGMPVPHLQTEDLTLLQLPPLRSDGVNFTRLLQPDGSPADHAYLAARAQTLAAALDDVAPDVLITELFPFGRRVLAGEFTDLLKRAAAQHPRPLICASIRDILAPPSKPAKAEATRALVTGSYDAVLVHSDPAITPLDRSWPVAPDVAAKLHYTGFVAPAPAGAHPQAAGKNEVLVSAGGGSVGHALFEAALAAATTDPAHRWRLLLGGENAVRRAEQLQAAASANVIVEPARADYRQMLRHVRASVSFCGYNTALDLLQAGTPAVLVPFDAGGEVEQRLRADALAELPACSVLYSADLTPETLLAHVERVANAPRRAPRTEGLDGAPQTVRIVEALVREMRP